MALYGPEDSQHPIKHNDESGDGLNLRISMELETGTYIVQIQHNDPANGTGS